MNNPELNIRNFVDELNYLTKLYDEGNPAVSDAEWDELYFKLQKLENEYQIYFEDSPTQRVNYQVVNQLNKVEHSHPMLSLDKTKDIEVIKSFVKNKDYIAMAKMDGLTCSLTYEHGKLVRAETRGNGIIGEDILHNALQVKNIPNKINYNEKLIIDGEIICTYKDFKPFADEYKNPRNFASGSIRLLDSKESSARHLTFVAWDLIEGGIEGIHFLNLKLKWLNSLGFTIVPMSLNNDSIENVINTLKDDCKFMSYPIDGIVFKYNNTIEYEAAGRTDHHFKGGIAYKFYDEEYETILRDIEWTMGRTGVLTPVAIFDPVDIDGTEVSRASLHNLSILQEYEYKGLKIGRKITVYKSNMIIPQIKDVIIPTTGWETQDFGVGYPARCPICHHWTEIKNDNGSAFLVCGNPDCEGKILNKIDHFCSKKGLDIKGLSKATLEKLMDWGWVNSIKDIFTLKNYKEEWIQKPGFGKASVEKILSAINQASTTILDKVIAAAGIPEVGSRVAKDLASHYKTWKSFREETDFTHLDGIGDVMNNNLLSFNYSEIDYIVTNYLHFTYKKEENNNLL